MSGYRVNKSTRMSVKQLIRDIAELEGIKLTDKEVREIDAKLASAWLDNLLDQPSDNSNKEKDNDNRNQ